MIIVNASARWNRALYQFEKTKDYEAFRDALIPLSQQKLHFVIRMKAEVNLTWIYSYLGQSQEAKEVCKKIIAKNKNLIGTSMAYATLIQELILEGDLEEAKKQWKDAMEIADADGRKAPLESLKLHLYGDILQEQYEQGLQRLADVPRSQEKWAQESEAGTFWNWYLRDKLQQDASEYRRKLEAIQDLHRGYAKYLNQ